MNNKFTKIEFLSNVCYALTTILIKVQYGELKANDNRFEISKQIDLFEVDKLDIDIQHSILDSELTKSINDILNVNFNNNYDFIKRTIKNSLFYLLKLNKQIRVNSYVDYFDLAQFQVVLQDIMLEPGETYSYTISAHLACNEDFLLKTDSFTQPGA